MKNISRTILFATLITAMILPFSSMGATMPQALAADQLSDIKKPDNQKIKEEQDVLIEKLMDIEAQQTIVKNQRQFDELEDKKQVILAKLYNNVKDNVKSNTATYSTKVVVSEQTKFTATKQAPSKSNFYINGSHKGCNGVNETYNFRASVYAGSSWLSVQQAFPSKITSGSGTNCATFDWTNNIYVSFADTNPFNNKGCHSNLNTEPVTNYSLNCGVALNGLWVAEITSDYEGNKTIEGYTYAAVL